MKESMGEEEGVIVAEVNIGLNKGNKETPKKYGKMWGIPVPWYAFIWPITQKMGEKSYETNPRRKERALSISGESENISS